MKNSCILKQVLWLLSILIVTCDSKGPVQRCLSRTIMKESDNLLNKTSEFKKLFPDDLISIKLLTNSLTKEFKDNCSTRNHLLLFYTKDVLSADLIRPEAQKSGIGEAFERMADMLMKCRDTKCQSTKSIEETAAMKELWAKITQLTLKEKLHKAINEMDMLLILIHRIARDIKRNRL
ncbi:hypothetical protein GDO81_010338 [Engystomops pustulosus]|uniref:Uncharacterized protein n=1 Tax=Engystomops pustulosus TaxID=76066 RepID=A0AAV7C0G3_ENGPU|nr:hypothetical protein GDO81_010338 [Engystomops pustulosus]